jgi:WD40 repeat protein
VPSPLASSSERPGSRPTKERPAGRRFLIATGTAHYPAMPSYNLPSVVTDLERIIAVLTHQLGYRRVNTLGLDPTGTVLRLELSRFFRDPDRRPDDFVVVYYAGHGEVLGANEHVLLPTDTDPSHLKATSVATADLAQLMLEETVVRRVLIILDTCYSGAGADDLAVRAFTSLDRPALGEVKRPGVVLVTATRPREVAHPGRFAAAFADAIDDLATGAHAPPNLAVGAVVGVLNRNLPSSQQARLHILGALGEPPPFLPNPRHEPRLVGLDLETQRWIREQRTEDLRTHFEPRSRGVELDIEPGSFFTGRHRALAELSAWLANFSGDTRVRIVTGDPGSGKSAVLGRLVMLADPQYRPSVPLREVAPETIPPAGAIDIAIHARNRTTEELLNSLIATAGVQAQSVDELLASLNSAPRPLVVVVDALDEAVDPARTVIELLQPLVRSTAQNAQLRLLIGTRRHLVPDLIRGFANATLVLDLDSEAYLQQADVVEYARRCLLGARSNSPYRHASSVVVTGVANAIASAAGQVFLVARIVSRSLAGDSTVADPSNPDWRASLPSSVGAAMEDYLRRFGNDEQRVRDLLLPVAYAEGAGLPWEDLWAPLASAIAGRPYSDEDLRWLQRQAGAYLVEGLTHGRSVYRLYHEALTDHLRRHDLRSTAEIQHAITAVLVEHVPLTPDESGRDWARAHPYIIAHLATHAAAAYELDGLLTDPRFLLNAEPVRLLDAAFTVKGQAARTAAAAYQRTFHHLHTKPTAEHAAYLELGARCEGATELVGKIGEWSLNRPWSTRWAQWRPTTPHRLVGRHDDTVNAVAVAELDGRPVAISGSDDWTIGVWDVATGVPIGRRIAHDGPVNAVAVAELDGRPVAISGSDDWTIRVWDVATGAPIGDSLIAHGVPGVRVGGRIIDRDSMGGILRADKEHINGAPIGRLLGHDGGVKAVVTAVLNRRPLIISGGFDATVRIWDLVSGIPISGPFIGHSGPVNAVAITELDGRLIVVSGSDDWTIRVWDLESRRTILPPFTGHSGTVNALAVTEVNGRSLVMSGSSDRTVRVWDLRTGSSMSLPLVGHTSGISGIAVTELDGACVIVSVSDDGTVQAWDLQYGFTVGAPFTGHDGLVASIAVTELNGRNVVITGSSDRTVRLWDLESSIKGGMPFMGHSGEIKAITVTKLDNRPVVLSGGNDQSIRVWDLKSGAAIGRPLMGHSGEINDLAVTSLLDRPIVLSASKDRTVRIWDLKTGWPLGIYVTGHIGPIHTVAVANLRGQPIVVSGSDDGTVRAWYMLSGAPIGDPLSGHDGAVNALAMAELDGRLIVASGGDDWTIRIWDVESGDSIGTPLTGHSGRVNSLAIANLDGRLVVLSASSDETLRLWDLRTNAPIGVPLAGHLASILSLAVGKIDERPMVISGSADRSVRLWDPSTGTTIGNPLIGHIGPVSDVAVTELDHRPVVVSGGDDRLVRIWDSNSGTPIGNAPIESGQVLDVTVTELGRQAVVITANSDSTVRLWDLESGAPIGKPLAGHYGAVNAVATAQLDGQPIVVSGGEDNAVHVWDLESGAPIGSPLAGHYGAVNAVATAQLDGQPVIVSGGDDGTVRIWDLGTGEAISTPLYDQYYNRVRAINAVATAQLNGRPIVVCGGSNGKVWVGDLDKGVFGRPLTDHYFAVNAVAAAELGGRLVIASGSDNGTVEIWELVEAPRGRPPRNALRHHRRPSMRPVLRVDDPVYGIVLTGGGPEPSIMCNYGDNTVSQFKLRTGVMDWKIEFDSLITSLAVWPKSMLIVAGWRGLMALQTDRISPSYSWSTQRSAVGISNKHIESFPQR